jgi:hypothetical protein
MSRSCLYAKKGLKQIRMFALLTVHQTNGGVMDQEHVDAAALLGTALAVVLAIMVAEGPFDYMNVPVAMTVLAIIVAYQWNRPRPSRIQSFALSCTIALVSTLIVGVLAEIYATQGFELEGTTKCQSPEIASIMYKCWRESKVPPRVVPISWVALTVGLFVFDRWIQRRRFPAKDETATLDGHPVVPVTSNSQKSGLRGDRPIWRISLNSCRPTKWRGSRQKSRSCSTIGRR